MRSRSQVAPMVSALALLGAVVAAAAADEKGDGQALQQAEAEIQRLTSLIPRFKWAVLPASAGEISLSQDDSLTIDDLRGVEIDDSPPVLGQPPQYPDNMSIDSEAKLYEAPGIRPFRLDYFNCEFIYGGWHNFEMQDYAVTHGFSLISPYGRKPEQMTHWPEGTEAAGWGGFIHWDRSMPANGVEAGRYDLLVDRPDLLGEKLEEPFKRTPSVLTWNQLMIDMEHAVLPPETLRKQPWYPHAASESARASFEAKYYRGYALTYISAVQAARRQGWPKVSVYGWAPFGRTWGGLEQAEARPGTDTAWNAYGKAIYDEVDIINPSVYSFYWSPRNVAYVLASNDLNSQMCRSTGKPKPIRPYFMPSLHGGGGGWRYWRDQPMSTEEVRAMFAMTLFCDVDGLVLWAWSGTGSHQTVDLSPKAMGDRGYLDVMVRAPFTLRDDRGREESFNRYDFLHITSIDPQSGEVRVKKVRATGDPRTALPDDAPEFVTTVEELRSNLRPIVEVVSGAVEGLALAKPIEYILRHGEVVIDVPAQEQFARVLPIVRRVKLGPWHVLATYDPAVIHGEAPRDVVLHDFDGVKGRSLHLAADTQTRIYILRATRADEAQHR